MISKRNRLQELKQLENKLKSIYNQNRYFKRIYESNNKKDKNDNGEKYIVISENGKNLFSKVSKEVVDYLTKFGCFDETLFNPKTNTIKIKNYFDILETIQYLVNIIEYDLMDGITIMEN